MKRYSLFFAMMACGCTNQSAIHLPSTHINEILEISCSDSPEKIVQSSMRNTSPGALTESLSKLESCPEDKKSKVFFELLPIRARSGDVPAQFLLAEHHRINHDSGRSVKWMRISSEAGNAVATAYLSDGYAKFSNEYGLKSSEDYIQFAKTRGRSFDALYIEDMLYEAIRLSKVENNTSSLKRAYINLGNIILYNLKHNSNEEFGEYGFSVERARSFFNTAIDASRKEGDFVGEAIGLSAMLVSYSYGGESSSKCPTWKQLKTLYSSHKKAIETDPRAVGVIETIRASTADCSK